MSVGYFSELVLEDHELNLMRTIMSYPERLDTLQVYRDSLVAMLPTVGNYLTGNQPEDNFLHQPTRYRYYEALWAEDISVGEIIAAIYEVDAAIAELETTADQMSAFGEQQVLVGCWTPAMVVYFLRQRLYNESRKHCAATV